VVSITKYPEQFLEKVMYLYDHPNETSRDEIEFKDGMILDRYSSPVSGKDGKHYGRIWTFRDITARKRAEEVLKENERKYRSLYQEFRGILDAIPDTLALLSPDLRIVWANEVDAKHMNLALSDCIGQPCYQLRHSRTEPCEICPVRECITSGLPKIGQSVTPDGRIWEVHASPHLGDHGEVTGVIEMARDISERKQAEEEKRRLEERLNRAEKMEALGTLAGGVAHDLNNVLGIVVGYAEMLLMKVDESSSIRPSLVNIMNGGQRAAAIVSDLLTLARRGVSRRDVLNLNKIIADCLQSPEFENLSSYNSYVQIKINLEPDLLNISGSSVHLSKTLFNLVSNAIESMTKGGIVTIKTANQYLDKPIQGYDEVREGDYVVLSVSDTGEGISAPDLKRIFEPFYTKKAMGRSGTGLGLAVVWGTVKDHHGYINVESKEGKGSIFTLYLPVTRQNISAEDIAVPISEFMGKGESILIVDDIKSSAIWRPKCSGR